MSGYHCKTGCGWRGGVWTFGWHYCIGAHSWWPAPPEVTS